MLNITNVLSDEHQNILKVIDIVLNECNKIEEGKKVDKIFFDKVINFIKKYADGFHHAKEENILFTEMLDNLENMHCNPIPVMLNEHDEGREYVKEMIESLEQNNDVNLLGNARGYCYLLQNHIFKEDNILYPMAEESLDDNQKQKIEELYNKVEIDNFFETNIQEFINGLQ
jgi:hemerythrin-like domain-containing protein